MKQLFTITFIAALILPFTGSFLWLKHQKKIVRKEVKHMMLQGIEEQDLVVLTFTESEIKTKLVWKHAKEFQFKGDMYDIVSRDFINGTHIYKCWLDKKETKLNRELASLFGIQWNKEKGKYHRAMNLDNFVKSLYYEEIEFLSLNGVFKKNHLYSYQASCSSNFTEKFCPPPELI